MLIYDPHYFYVMANKMINGFCQFNRRQKKCTHKKLELNHAMHLQGSRNLYKMKRKIAYLLYN